MSNKFIKLVEQIQLDRQDKEPKLGEVITGSVLASNSQGVYLDINKCYEAFVNINELGEKKDFKLGERVEVLLVDREKKTKGVFRASVKKIEDKNKWKQLEELQGQNLEVSISKIVKSGAEVIISSTNQTAFIPFKLMDYKYETLKNIAQNEWVGKKIPARIHEIDQEKNKIILDHKTISEEQMKAKSQEVMSKLAIGQEITGKVVRTTKFVVFIEYQGIDILIPSSELSWARLKEPSDLVNVGDDISGKVFKIDQDNLQVAISRKQIVPDPWTVIDEKKYAVGSKHEAKVVSHAEFGFFAEVEPGIEALVHKSTYSEKEFPAVNTKLNLEIINLEKDKRRMGTKIVETEIKIENDNNEQEESGRTSEDPKELEHAK